MNVCGNEIADDLAKENSLKNANSDSCLIFSETASRIKQDINALWRVAPVHECYACSHRVFVTILAQL